MTDHAQREALNAQINALRQVPISPGDIGDLDSGDVAWNEALDAVLALPALRASAPPAPEGDKVCASCGVAALNPGDECCRECSGTRWRATARTALGEPPTAGEGTDAHDECARCGGLPPEGSPMINHAQREALATRLEASARRMRVNWSPQAMVAIWPDVLDMEAAAAALRNSAPLDVAAELRRIGMDDSVSVRSAARPNHVMPGVKALMVEGADEIERLRHLHTARTALGEPPTGMREVPGTPGLYETELAEYRAGRLAGPPAFPVGEAKPILDLDALASETTQKVVFLPFIMRHGLDKSQILEVRAAIRAALDRMKETR